LFWDKIKKKIMKKIKNPDIKIVKENILNTLNEIGISAHEIILFGSRARKDFTPLIDYDILIITEEPFEINKKMSISKNIRQYLAHSGLDYD